MTWVYIKTESNLWTVGFYDPQGEFQPDSDHDSRDAARAQVHYLNGGTAEDEHDQRAEDESNYQRMIGEMLRQRR